MSDDIEITIGAEDNASETLKALNENLKELFKTASEGKETFAGLMEGLDGAAAAFGGSTDSLTGWATALDGAIARGKEALDILNKISAAGGVTSATVAIGGGLTAVAGGIYIGAKLIEQNANLESLRNAQPSGESQAAGRQAELQGLGDRIPAGDYARITSEANRRYGHNDAMFREFIRQGVQAREAELAGQPSAAAGRVAADQAERARNEQWYKDYGRAAEKEKAEAAREAEKAAAEEAAAADKVYADATREAAAIRRKNASAADLLQQDQIKLTALALGGYLGGEEYEWALLNAGADHAIKKPDAAKYTPPKNVSGLGGPNLLETRALTRGMMSETSALDLLEKQYEELKQGNHAQRLEAKRMEQQLQDMRDAANFQFVTIQI